MVDRPMLDDVPNTAPDEPDLQQPGDDKIRCEACPIRCFIRPGNTGSCDRYGNVDGVLTRMDPVTVLHRAVSRGEEIISFAGSDRDHEVTLIAAGAGTTYPDYKPAPFIVAADVAGVDTITVVTEGIFSYCGVKVKIDTDRHLGEETATVRYEGQPVGHVTTTEYGSQMLSLGGVHHLTGLGKHAGLATMHVLELLCEKHAVELQIDGGAHVVARAGGAPLINGVEEQRMRVGCGSATVGMFAGQWRELVDEVVVVDEHITGVLSEHQAGAVLGMRPTGVKIRGRRSTPGRIFNVADPGTGWGGTTIADPLDILLPFNPKTAWPGLRLLMTSTTGEDWAYYELDEALRPVPATASAEVAASVRRIGDNCESALCSVVFMAGAGGSLRAGTTRSPIALTRSIHDGETRVTIGGAPVYLWPGGGITVMVDVQRVPPGSFGHVPTPAIVAPLEFTLERAAYAAMGGHLDSVRTLADVLATERIRYVAADERYGASPPG